MVYIITVKPITYYLAALLGVYSLAGPILFFINIVLPMFIVLCALAYAVFIWETTEIPAHGSTGYVEISTPSRLALDAVIIDIHRSDFDAPSSPDSSSGSSDFSSSPSSSYDDEESDMYSNLSLPEIWALQGQITTSKSSNGKLKEEQAEQEKEKAAKVPSEYVSEEGLWITPGNYKSAFDWADDDDTELAPLDFDDFDCDLAWDPPLQRRTSAPSKYSELPPNIIVTAPLDFICEESEEEEEEEVEQADKDVEWDFSPEPREDDCDEFEARFVSMSETRLIKTHTLARPESSRRYERAPSIANRTDAWLICMGRLPRSEVWDL